MPTCREPVNAVQPLRWMRSPRLSRACRAQPGGAQGTDVLWRAEVKFNARHRLLIGQVRGERRITVTPAYQPRCGTTHDREHPRLRSFQWVCPAQVLFDTSGFAGARIGESIETI